MVTRHRVIVYLSSFFSADLSILPIPNDYLHTVLPYSLVQHTSSKLSRKVYRRPQRPSRPYMVLMILICPLGRHHSSLRILVSSSNFNAQYCRRMLPVRILIVLQDMFALPSHSIAFPPTRIVPHKNPMGIPENR